MLLTPLPPPSSPSWLNIPTGQVYEIASADRVSITEIEGAEANRMILDLCDESICLLDHVGTPIGNGCVRVRVVCVCDGHGLIMCVSVRMSMTPCDLQVANEVAFRSFLAHR